MRLLQYDLVNITRSANLIAGYLKDYYEREATNPVQTNVLYRSPKSVIIHKALEADRLILFNAFYRFIEDEPSKTFGEYYQSVEYLSAMSEDIYEIVDSYNSKKYVELVGIIKKTKLALDVSAKILSEHKLAKFISEEVEELLNKFILRYYDIVIEANDKDGNMERQTDIMKLSNTVFSDMLKRLMEIKVNRPETYTPRLNEIENLLSNARKDIYKIKQEGIKMSKQVEYQYDLIINGTKHEKDSSLNQNSILQILQNVEQKIQVPLSRKTI